MISAFLDPFCLLPCSCSLFLARFMFAGLSEVIFFCQSISTPPKFGNLNNFQTNRCFFPMGKLSKMIFVCLGATIFSGIIVFDTHNLIERFEYDDFIWAAVSLYIDIFAFFVSTANTLSDIEG